MFNFLKDKLKNAIKKISDKVEDIAKSKEETQKIEEIEKIIEEPVKEKIKEEKTTLKKEKEISKKRKEKEELREIEEVLKESQIEKTEKKLEESEIKKEEEILEEPKKVKKIEEQKIEKIEEKKGFFSKILGIKEKIVEKVTTTKLTKKEFEELFWELELSLLENNVALAVVEKLKQDLEKNLVDKSIKRDKIEETITSSLKQTVNELLIEQDFWKTIEDKKSKPSIICFFGINGSGKTTTVAKLTQQILDMNKKVVLAAADTFRSAAIQQLEEHANKLNVKIIKHNYGSDPAAVAFDAIAYAKANNIDFVLIDTAGRMHSNVNLIDEMKKIVRVAKPDLKIFVGEALTGNDCIEQANKFNEAVGIDGIIMTKADVDEKGGAPLSISYITNKPIYFLGVGQNYKDLKKFDKELIIKNLF